MWIYVPLAVIFAIYSVHWYLTRNYNHWKKKNIFGPIPVPLFGNTKELALRSKYVGSLFQEFYDQFPNEKIVGIFRMTKPRLLIRDLDMIKNILVQDFEFFSDRGHRLEKDGLSANLFSAEVNTWRVLRTKFTPLFTSGKLKNMFHLIEECADRFMIYFDSACHEQPEQNILLASRMFTMSSIAACAFGIDINLNDPKLSVLHRLDALILESKFGLEFLMMIPGLLPSLKNFIFPKELNDFFYDLVQTVFAQRNGVPSNRNDFMDLMLEMKQRKMAHGNKTSDKSEITVELTDGMIAAQAFVFYIAGYETSSTTLSFLLYELTQYPDIQDKVIAEIDKVLEKSGGKLTYDALFDMPYLSKVFDETLRKYPIVDPLQRSAQADYQIPGTNNTIKKGETVFISVLGIHYDEKYYPKPEVFDPERFCTENSKDRHSCAYLPFGAGPRNCIGMRFAKVQSRMFLVKLLSKYRVEASDNTPKVIRPDPIRVLLGPRNGVLLNIIPRYK